MGRALRAEQFAVDEISIIHVVQRCVRRAFLVGADSHSGKNYGYRREWIRRRLEALASAFGIDVLSYAIMSNHLHLILRNRPDIVAEWSDEEVARRWLSLFPGRRLDEQLGAPTQNDIQALLLDVERLQSIRQRLSDISWFMRSLSEPIARMANRQDECTGRFWEGRFKAQRIADEAGLLACSLYVDLNPVRAAMAESVAESKHTSAFDRIESAKGGTIDSAALPLVPDKQLVGNPRMQSQSVQPERGKVRHAAGIRTGGRVPRDGWLSPLQLDSSRDVGDPQVSSAYTRASDRGFLHLNQQEYVQLLNWVSERSQAKEGRPEVPVPARRLAGRLGIDLEMWRDLVWNFRRYFGTSSCAGSPTAMTNDARSRGRRWAKGQRTVATCFIS